MSGYDVIRDFLIKGGPVLWPLVACSPVSLTITIERMLFWWRARPALVIHDNGNDL